MRYIEEFRNGEFASALSKEISKAVDVKRDYKFMEFCGGHTHAIHRYGIPSLLPENVEMIHGPGCPVCVLPIAKVDQAVELAKNPDVIFCSYGDMLRVPGSNGLSLLKAKAQGADIRMVYSVDDALNIAKKHSDKKVIFFAIGFETTTPPTSVAIKEAKAIGLKNFFVFCNHVLTPPALNAILQIQNADGESGVRLDGIVGPAHVSIVIGSKAYEAVGQKHAKPIVISGFEPLDVLQSILMLIHQTNAGKHVVENQYTRAVSREGNLKSQALRAEVFELRDKFEWRGVGWIPDSALKIKDAYAEFDVEKCFELSDVSNAQENNACECGAILCGMKKPFECALFEKVCTPENPMGACMVSSEGACAAYYAYSRGQIK